MGTAPSKENAASTTQEVVTKDSFPMDGIRLSYLAEFIEKCCKGREQIKDMTTKQICDTFIKKETEKEKISFVDMLKRIDNENEAKKQQQKQQQGLLNEAPVAKYVDKAQVFISHA